MKTTKPEVGETYHCEECGMTVKVTVACNSQKDVAPSFTAVARRCEKRSARA